VYRHLTEVRVSSPACALFLVKVSHHLAPVDLLQPMIVHYWAKFAEQNAQGSIVEALDDQKYFGTTGERYNVSKVLSVFTARELAKLPAVTSGKVNVNSANPGEQPFRSGKFA
jgi:hypothetical protein